MKVKDKAQRHNLFLNAEHEKMLNEIAELKNLTELKSTSKVVRFIISDYYEMLTNGNSKSKDVKLHAIGKDVSMILNLICSLIANTPSLNEGDKHVRNENVLLYWQSLKHIERVINERRTGYGSRPVMPVEFKAMMETKPIDESYLAQLESEKRDADFDKLFELSPFKAGE